MRTANSFLPSFHSPLPRPPTPQFQDNPHAPLRSDCDAQLLISIPLREPIKMSGISFRAPAPSGEVYGPKTVKLFVNQPHLDFAEAESSKPAAEITLKAQDIKNGTVQELKMVKFQSVSTVTVFICDNQGGSDKTCLSRISLLGSVQAGLDMKAFKAVG